MSYATMEQTSKYWGPWRSTRSSASSTTKSSIPSWASSPYYSNEPSWEEQAFARDSAAAHLGGCVWPPRSYSCSFCHREFRSAQALGGHMNVHRRDRALLRQGSFPEDDGHEEEAPVVQSQGEGGGPFFYRPASNPTTPSTTATSSNSVAIVNRGTPTPPPPPPHPPPYLASIIKESNNKLFMSIPASMTTRLEAKDQCYRVDDVESSGRMKRRRVDHPSVTLPIFVQTTVSMVAENKSQGVDPDARVPKTIIISNPSRNSIPPRLVDQQQEVDLELRLGFAPKVT